MTSTTDFTAELRAEEEADRGKTADPGACGTCRWHVSEGRPVEHEGCAARATILKAPDHPSYEVLADLTAEEKAALPARFHTPVFDDCGQPNAWLCSVCWGDAWVTAWPCATATKHGTDVFTREHEAEQQQKQQAAGLEQARRWATDLEAQLALATTFTIPKASGLGHILLERECAATDKWAVTNGGLGHGVWVNNRWQHIPVISLHDAFPYQLHEALEIGHQLANGSPS